MRFGRTCCTSSGSGVVRALAPRTWFTGPLPAREAVPQDATRDDSQMLAGAPQAA